MSPKINSCSTMMVFVHELIDLYTFEGDPAHNSNVDDLLFYVHWLYCHSIHHLNYLIMA